MFDKSCVLHRLGEEAIKIFCRVSSFLEVVVKYYCFGDDFRVKHLVFMLWNEESEVPKVAKRASDWICSVCDIWPIRCEANCN